MTLTDKISRRKLLKLTASISVAGATPISTVFASGFENHVASLKSSLIDRGNERSLVERALSRTRFDTLVEKVASSQSEFVTPLWQYLANMNAESRVRDGLKKKQEWSKTLKQISERTGVDEHLVLSIWGIETHFGSILSNNSLIRPVVPSLATLGYVAERRADYALNELEAVIKIAKTGITDFESMVGSWAGAMGHTQFIPSTYLAYAEDFNGNGRPDIWNSIPDSLYSTACYFRSHEFTPGETWGVAVKLPGGFDYFNVDENDFFTTASIWEHGVVPLEPYDSSKFANIGRIIAPTGARGPAFVLFPNFDVIKRYNASTNYTLAVGMLTNRLSGQKPWEMNWPVDELPLTREQKKSLQRHLNKLGYYDGEIDGVIGSGSRKAVKMLQVKIGMIPDGYASTKLFAKINA